MLSEVGESHSDVVVIELASLVATEVTILPSIEVHVNLVSAY